MIKAPDQNAGMDLSADSLEEALSPRQNMPGQMG